MAPGRLRGDVSRVRVSDFTSIPVLITAGRCAISCKAHQTSEEEPHRLCDPIGFATASCTDNTRRSRVATCERPAILAFWPGHWTRMIPQGCPARHIPNQGDHLLRDVPFQRARQNACPTPYASHRVSARCARDLGMVGTARAGTLRQGLCSRTWTGQGKAWQKSLPAHRSWPNSLRRQGLSQGATSCLLTAVGERGTERHL